MPYTIFIMVWLMSKRLKNTIAKHKRGDEEREEGMQLWMSNDKKCKQRNKAQHSYTCTLCVSTHEQRIVQTGISFVIRSPLFVYLAE